MAQFEVVRTGKASTKPAEVRPPDELLDKHPDGTIVKGPDDVQWIIAPAVPRRFQRVKRAVSAS
jgi:hypothetical protein